jgi:hypothetical protein
MANEITIEITPPPPITIEVLTGYGVPVNVGGGGGGSLTVRDADGNPSGTVTEIVFPNGTVSIGGPTATITGLQGPQGIQGPAGPNAINVNTATVFDGVLIGDGAGVYAEPELPIALGGTGQNTAVDAINALLPTQTDNVGCFLFTNGANVSWAYVEWGSLVGDPDDNADLRTYVETYVLTALSFIGQQQLTLAQLRIARRNLLTGSAPTAAYDGNGRLSTLTYSDGSVKTLTYTAGRVTRIDHVYTVPARTYRKDISYDGNGRFQSITESIF